MGMRVHVCTKHIVEYGHSEGFNYTYQDFKNMLCGLGCDYSGEIDDTDWEVDRDKYNKALNLIKAHKAEIVKAAKGLDIDVNGIDNISRVATSMRYACDKDVAAFSESDVDDVIELMERYEEEGEPGSCYLNFSAF